MDKRLHFDYPWTSKNPKDYPAIIREFKDNGADNFLINDQLLAAMIENREVVDTFRKLCKDMEVSFDMVHGLYGNYDHNDLNNADLATRPAMWDRHAKAMEIAASFGCKTYVIHTGAWQYIANKVPLETLRPLAVESIEKLLPLAEKNRLILAVENSFEPPNAAREVLALVEQFKESPWIGVCYDAGHANIMTSAPGKDIALYKESGLANAWWDNGVIQEDNALEKLADYVVTCHLHDNKGYSDLHGMPFDGTIDWSTLLPKILACPKLIDILAEVCLGYGECWPGILLSPIGGYSIRRLTDTFKKLGF